ncbi:MAG: hypothetical protein Q9M31_09625 [Mariprofundus sp.]|nr:hypothetical protein [Mariprofundus sp.]
MIRFFSVFVTCIWLAIITPASAQNSIVISPIATNNQAQAVVTAKAIFLLLKVERRASLPEQILFEQDLRRNSHIADMSLYQVNRAGQTYRLRLNGGDDQWLHDWFTLRGMHLKPTIEGWVASQGIPAQ